VRRVERMDVVYTTLEESLICLKITEMEKLFGTLSMWSYRSWCWRTHSLVPCSIVSYHAFPAAGRLTSGAWMIVSIEVAMAPFKRRSITESRLTMHQGRRSSNTSLYHSVWYRIVRIARMHDAILQKLMLDSPLYAPPVRSLRMLVVGRP
jgi:hypothetical protein